MNAFKSLDRRHMLQQVSLRAPQLSAWASFCYRSHSHLFLQNGHPLSSQQGVQQGDPLGPLFFSLAWHSVIEALPANLSMNLWRPDDGHLIGTPDTPRSCLAILESEGAKISVCLNPAKCRLWGPAIHADQMEEDSTWGRIPHIPWSPNSGI